MARLPKLAQRVSCTVPGYEDSGIYLDVWINAPQRFFDQWQDMIRDARVIDENGNQVYETDDKGEVKTDPKTFEPIPVIDTDKLLAAARYYIENLVIEFSLEEDMDGTPLNIHDEDFWERLPEDLILWMQSAIAESVAERRKQGKAGAKLQGIIGR